MNINQITETHYDKSHVCKTPDAIYTISIKRDTVAVSVKLPFELEIDKDSSKKLEAELHYAVEKVLASLFKNAG
jgi:hypothetical protein